VVRVKSGLRVRVRVGIRIGIKFSESVSHHVLVGLGEGEGGRRKEEGGRGKEEEGRGGVEVLEVTPSRP
jgi:hypothetical protein